MLGRVHLAWPVIGRFTAESLFVRAADLEPDNPEPHYWAAMTGVALGGDDGESMARPRFERVLALNPDYRDAFGQWFRLYRDDDARRRAVRLLERHAGSPTADRRRAGLLIELGAYAEADSVLRALTRLPGTGAGPWALLAQSLFEQGRDAEGAAAYEEALARADDDPDTLLWRQARAIVTPLERAAWERGPRDRQAFFRLLWARRDPRAATQANERIGEHFRRVAEARRQFALLHPASLWHRSARYRALSDVGGLPPGRAAQQVLTEARGEGCTAQISGVRDLPYLVGQGSRAPSPDAGETPNREDGLDDRGRVFVRHGAPTERRVFSLDGETWCYAREDGVLRVTFLRRTGAAGWDAAGDMVFTPVMTGEAESAVELTATDRPTLPATLRFTFWPATFQNRDDGTLTELLLFPDSLTAAATLVDWRGRTVARDSATGRFLRLVGAPGRYALLLDGARGGRLGRYRKTVDLPDYTAGLAVSSLLVGAGELGATRSTLAAAAPAGLALAAERPLRVYAEVYGLGEDFGVARYDVTYRFERVDRAFLDLARRERVITIAFQREVPHAPRLVESIVVDPGRLPRGRYRLHVEVVDAVRRARAPSASLTFELR